MFYRPLLLLVFAALVAWVLYTVYCVAVNYLRARKISVPIIILPIDPGNPLWMSIDTKIIPLFKRIPFGTGNFTRFNWRGWEIQDRFRAHLQLGDVFVFVSPSKNWLQVCNAEALADIFQRRGDFVRPTEMLGKPHSTIDARRGAKNVLNAEMLNVFGPNLGTTEGQQWQRHRKITAACFNEQNNELVWTESVRQANGMLMYWLTKSSIRSVADDTRTLSLHVMSSAGFGKSYPYKGSEEASSTEDSSSYKRAPQLILDNCIPLVILGPNNLSKWWLPKKWKEIYQATLTFRQYMTELYEEEKQAMLHSKSGGNNLMTSLIRASQKMSEAADTAKIKEDDIISHHEQGGLTETEIYGNIFVFNFAGHDTTAHALAFGIVLLATRPDVQDWIAEELHYVLEDQEPEEWSYNSTFPRLRRCLAVLNETVRLYSPVAIVKTTNAHPQPLKIGDKTILIPANTMLIPSYSALHTHPRYWGSDSLVWQPSRWIMSSSSSSSTHQSTGLPSKNNPLASETLIQHPKNANPFIAWSAGARNCPGQKFSQVEFVAAIASLFRNWKIKPVLEKGEDDAAARLRIERLVEKESGMVLLLQMLHPEKAVLTWERR